MRPIRELFPAKTDNFWETMNSHSARVGFRVPEYQRTYNWSQEKIKRLLEDCLNGFYYLSESKNKDEYKYTFLATMILVSEQSENSFDGTSLSIVDGQQRLTTLILICCSLIQELLLHCEDRSHLKPEVSMWIEKEVNHVCETLFSCVIGQLPGRVTTSLFPRIVRGEDNRAPTPKEAEYFSITANFLMNFANFYKGGMASFDPKPKKESDTEERLYFQNYKYIKEQVSRIYEDKKTPSETTKEELEYEQVQHESFERAGLRNLFEKLTVLGEEEDQNRAISHISQNSASSGLIRLLLFSHYLMRCVILTRVETKDEDSAFDIFDALNTTGEPLTALETFKPRVISFEDKIARYHNSESEQYFDRIEKYLNAVYKETEKRQNATKDLLITFALYLDGYKLSRDLASQRAYLRNAFDKSKQKQTKRKIVESLAEIAEFRYRHWNIESIPNLSTGDIKRDDILKLCFRFILDMKTSMALPILARYWVEYRENDTDSFVDSVKAVTAFLVLRRSVTGGTGGIDGDFRKIINADSQDKKKPFCVGLNHTNSLPSVEELKANLREHLEIRLEVKDKKTWINQAREVDLAKRSRPLCRFLLFAASHNARPNKAGLISREGIIPADEINLLSFEKWCGQQYGTVEHVAPQSISGSGDGWDPKIYQNPYTRDTIGNLVLLPQRENSMIGNNSWANKKLFYAALAAETQDERKNLLSKVKARKHGGSFKAISEKLRNESLYMLSPLNKVRKWDKQFIKRRADNILGLVWDEIAPWLSYK